MTVESGASCQAERTRLVFSCYYYRYICYILCSLVLLKFLCSCYKYEFSFTSARARARTRVPILVSRAIDKYRPADATICFLLIVNKQKKMPCFLRLDISHYVSFITRWKIFISVPPKVKTFYIMILCLLTKTTDFTDLQ